MSSPGSTGEWQFIDCKSVQSLHGLSDLLTEKYGSGKFSVETRQNVYCIRAETSSAPLDLVSQGCNPVSYFAS
ncbi:hypothetical protein CCUS01_14375 [Colletotrichum cuscutae]|uniref:Uncharacterized protein n=2 Tax=Colletotrichum acutatum species complex TaxID=2707335 RepID=A0AAI9YT88_9PEZI|nr:uncharacterized protein CCOS01_10222 [Colletotrichum costaricense]KAK1490780.1 hypothetical protein CCUS01_14375 [Colletotrichum cuscutae]KAK1522510.1 hypothetical protein CCOS01_10222 [Colletotrichum costaricense]